MLDQPLRAPSRRAPTLIGVLATAALVLAACSGSASSLPSVNLPTSLPSIGGNGSPLAACVDASTKAVLDQLTTSGADVPSLLQANKDALLAGLQTFQPADDATKAWRDEFVAALQDGDMTKAETKVQAVVSGGVTLTAC